MKRLRGTSEMHLSAMSMRSADVHRNGMIERQAEEIAALRKDAGQLEYADCTLCSAVPSSGFYTGCMVKDGNAAGWSCKQGKLVRWRGDAILPDTTNAAPDAEYWHRVADERSAEIIRQAEEIAEVKKQAAIFEHGHMAAESQIDQMAEEIAALREQVLAHEAALKEAYELGRRDTLRIVDSRT